MNNFLKIKVEIYFTRDCFVNKRIIGECIGVSVDKGLLRINYDNSYFEYYNLDKIFYYCVTECEEELIIKKGD